MDKIIISDLYEMSVEEVLEIIDNRTSLIIEVPIPEITGSDSHLNIAYGYLDIALISEKLSDVSEKISYQYKCFESGYSVFTVLFNIEVANFVKLADVLKWIAEGRKGENPDYDEAFDEIPIDDKEFLLKFPEIIDDFFVNYIGGYYDIDDESLVAEFQYYPERKYWFWRSLYSNYIGVDLYLSQNCWIMRQEGDLDRVLKEYGLHKQDILLEEAKIVCIGKDKVLYNSENIVVFPDNNLVFQAQKCVAKLSEKKLGEECEYGGTIDWYYEDYDASFKKILLSKDGDIIVALDNMYYYIFFYPKNLDFCDIENLNVRTNRFFKDLDLIKGNDNDITCDWGRLDDDKFEELCYDVIYNDSRFDNMTIEKMGKSRSRDGGRDIIVYTRALPGKMPEKYIFQCKLLTSGVNSLTAKKVMDVTDTIMQYGAKGYGVMTNVVIDSTLHDKLEGIKNNFHVETERWSKLKIERFLARHPMIKERYFPNN